MASFPLGTRRLLQDSPTGSWGHSAHNNGYLPYKIAINQFNYTILMLITFVAFLIIIIVCWSIRNKFSGGQGQSAPGNDGGSNALVNGGADSRSNTGNKGLDDVEIEESGIKFQFRVGDKATVKAGKGMSNVSDGLLGEGVGSKDPSEDFEQECIICLTDYKDGETLKKLNVCNHFFHEGCIDTWLHCNVSCPLCRARVVPEKKLEDMKDVVEDVDTAASSGASVSQPRTSSNQEV